LLFKCFAGCDASLIMRAFAASDALAFTRAPENHGRNRPAPPMRGLIREIWNAGLPTSGTRAATYLETRSLFAAPASLRFNARTPLGRGSAVRFRPAMIAALDEGGTLVAIHRTFLDARGSALAPDLPEPRRMLGRPLGGAVKLGQPTHCLGLAEGIETALAAMQLLEIPVWAALGAERMHTVVIPDEVSELLLLPDNDRAGQAGAARAARAHRRDGRSVERILPPRPYNDWNDVLRAGGEGERSLWRAVA
jgi:hypothetical protein